jgi:hypothetical protein
MGKTIALCARCTTELAKREAPPLSNLTSWVEGDAAGALHPTKSRALHAISWVPGDPPFALHHEYGTEAETRGTNSFGGKEGKARGWTAVFARAFRIALH